MLQAVIHKKRRRNLNEPWAYEDYITSSFFGPIQYLCTENIWKVLLQVFPLNSDHVNTTPKSIKFDFWPKINHIEPDLLIRIEYAKNYVEYLHIEVKWNSGENPREEEDDHQVVRQRKCIRKEYSKREKLRSIYLVRDEGKAKREFEEVGSEDISIISWVEIGRRLRDWSSPPDACMLWRKHAVAYLREMSLDVFEGFSSKGLFTADSFDCLKRTHLNGILFFSSFSGFVFKIPKYICSEREFIFYQEG